MLFKHYNIFPFNLVVLILQELLWISLLIMLNYIKVLILCRLPKWFINYI